MDIYILSGARTPSGSFLGALSSMPASKLGAVAIDGAITRANISADKVDEVIMGNVVQAGQGQAPGRQATRYSSVSDATPSSTVNKVCGSGMKSIIMACQSIKSGEGQVVVAGGMESMSMAPFLIPSGRTGHKFGSTQMRDAMEWDGLRDIYNDVPMGNYAEATATKYGFSREEQDAFAIESFKRAQKAIENGNFAKEIVPVTIKNRKGEVVVDTDEGPFKANFEKIPKLRPAFTKDGTVTAANSSTINDGAAAVVVAGEEYKDQAKFKIVAYAEYSHEPEWFTTAPVGAMKKCFKKANLSISDIDLFEINEAFAVVAMAAMKDLELPHEKVNVFGGGVSLGHPIGCSGTRIIVTLMNALQEKNLKRGMASICIGGGEALAMIIERI